MGKLHFIKDAQKKHAKRKLRWKIACLTLLGLVIAEHIYILLYMR